MLSFGMCWPKRFAYILHIIFEYPFHGPVTVDILLSFINEYAKLVEINIKDRPVIRGKRRSYQSSASSWKKLMIFVLHFLGMKEGSIKSPTNGNPTD